MGGELYSVYKAKNLFGSVEHARYYMACACSALNHLHSLSIVSRSLKPEDCVLTEDGRLKMVDLGLAKFIVDRTFTTCGTPDYFSPEIICAAGHSFSVDWWLVGIMTFELLSGSPPFEASTPMQIYSQVMKGIGKVEIPATVPPAAKSLIYKLCTPTPGNRLPVLHGFEALAKTDFFKPLGPWEGLPQMTPPFVPVMEKGPLSNFTGNPADIPKSFRTPHEPPAAEEWAIFGPEGSQDGFA